MLRSKAIVWVEKKFSWGQLHFALGRSSDGFIFQRERLQKAVIYMIYAPFLTLHLTIDATPSQ